MTDRLGALEAALADVMRPIMEDAVGRMTRELERSMRHLKPLAVAAPEAGGLLGVSEATIRRLVTRGELPTVPHVGDRVLIPVSAIEAYVDRAAGDPGTRPHAPPRSA